MFSGCNGSKQAVSMPEHAEPVTYSILSKGAYCAYPDSANLWIEDAAAFRELWTSMHQNQMPTPAAPEVDFTTHAVVASFMGSRNSGGYAVVLNQIAAENNTAYVAVEYISPGEGCMTTSAITFPYVLALVERGAVTEARFVVSSTQQDCNN